MKIVKIFGGLGNQMFQYAFALYLFKKTKDVVKIDNGVNTNKKDTYRQYSLDNFNITLSLASKEEVESIKYPKGIFSKILIAINKKVFRKFNIGYEDWVLNKKKYYYDGFWQSYKYLEEIKDTLLKEFSLKKSFSQEILDLVNNIKNTNSVSIHIRRGDYVSSKKNQVIYGTFGLEYYEEAVKFMKRNTKTLPTFFIFSDDILWVKENVKVEGDVVYISDNKDLKDYEELILMSLCKNNIIANSTFSFWGAWLNTNKEKVVITPKVWNKKFSSHFENLIPMGWIRI